MTTLRRFRAPLLDPTQDRPEGLRGAAGAPADTRYDVYRNNVTHSLIAALHSAFPLVLKVLGTQNFDRLAPAYVRAHPPTSPLMMHYGADLPDFLAAQPQLSKMGYLPDCARLDLALRRSYHAADSAPFDLEMFQQLTPEEMMQTQLIPAPATVLLRSRWPLFDIWRFNMQADAPKPQMQAQDMLITRPEFDPAPHLLPPGGGDWFAALAEGATLDQAHDTALALVPAFDLGAALGLCFATGAFRAKNGG
ncbi:DNA-binding domain-containing protein [Thalassovita sp.]|uniref:DNA-binding domain-containing protein n=1 Tax=Thalassovita sp. TaxID=1979401 RepID=UPI002B272274|nr:DNA-binding domain-containing protein [Thalassovita sp.]